MAEIANAIDDMRAFGTCYVMVDMAGNVSRVDPSRIEAFRPKT